MGAAVSKSWVALAGVLVTLATVACAPMFSPAHVATDGDALIYGTVFDRAHEIVVREYYDPEIVQAELEPHTPAFRAAALAASTDREFYAILNDYLFSLGDLHTNARKELSEERPPVPA